MQTVKKESIRIGRTIYGTWIVERRKGMTLDFEKGVTNISTWEKEYETCNRMKAVGVAEFLQNTIK